MLHYCDSKNIWLFKLVFWIINGIALWNIIVISCFQLILALCLYLIDGKYTWNCSISHSKEEQKKNVIRLWRLRADCKEEHWWATLFSPWVQCVKYRWGTNGRFDSLNNDVGDEQQGSKTSHQSEFITVSRMLILKLFVGAKAPELNVTSVVFISGETVARRQECVGKSFSTKIKSVLTTSTS